MPRLRTQRGFSLSVVRAASDHRVVLAPDTLLVDEAQTSRLRSSSPS
jgi:hypothetical protein